MNLVHGGDLRPLTHQHPDVFHPASQLWVRRHSDAPWVIDLPLTADRDGLWVNKFVPHHTGRLDDVTWVAPNGIRYLNPEIVLLFKARLRRSKDLRDLERTWPRLPREKQAWLRQMLRGVDEHHPWLELTVDDGL
jgi:hypothetical protein